MDGVHHRQDALTIATTPALTVSGKCGRAKLAENGAVELYNLKDDIGDRYYQFDVDDKGVAKGIVHVSQEKPAPG